jgi:hypothetical protein
MRTQYLLDDVRRRTGEAVRRVLARQAHDRRARRRRRALMAGVLAGAAAGTWGLWAAWQWAFAPAPVAGRVAEAHVPEHQRSGPLANPWGAGTPVLGERGPEGAASGAMSAAATAGAASAAQQAPTRPDATLASPAAQAAVRAALTQLRGSARAADFVRQAMESRDPPALAAAWMAERHCRHVAQWRLTLEWRMRAQNPGARPDPNAPLPAAGVHPQLRTLHARCGDMPEDSAVDSALAAAGFGATGDLPEPTRRPLDLARAVSVGDPVLLATVIDAASAEEVNTYLARHTRAAAAADTPADVLKAALWLASCRAGAAAGGAGAARGGHPACAEHPALWLACTQQGLCDARDLHDLLLRTMPADLWHTSERLAAELVPLMGK